LATQDQAVFDTRQTQLVGWGGNALGGAPAHDIGSPATRTAQPKEVAFVRRPSASLATQAREH
jgi:hypothetical protein